MAFEKEEEQASASGFPPEYTAPSDQLKAGNHDSDNYAETKHYAKGAKITNWIGRNVSGVTIGLIQLRARLPLVPGNMGNASTFDFPMLYREMTPDNPYSVGSLEPEKETNCIEEMVKAANWLELQGVRAIMANCGFFGNYQRIIQDKIDTPFFSSSLIQLPTIIQSLPRGKKVGVITANAEVLRACPAIENCGVSPEDKANRVVIDDCGDSAAFGPIVAQDSNEFDIYAIEEAIVTAAKRLTTDNPDVCTILLECTELPPAAHAVQAAVKMPVWDYVTLTKWIHDGCLRRQLTGFV